MESEAKPLETLDRLCIHTITNKPWSLRKAVAEYEKAGIKGITVWRDTLDGHDIRGMGQLIRDHGIEIVSLCRGGFFPAATSAGKQKAFADNRLAIDQAAELGAPMIVLVCGAIPSQPLETSRQQIREGIEALLPHCEAHNVKLAIEPLHPMYADDRSAINTLAQANELAEAINHSHVGVAVDVYHLWWDPNLQAEIKRCGRNKHLFAFHICDWRTPTEDMLLDRGLMGEGCIPVRKIRGWVEETGFKGFNEVEIFSKRHWARDQNEFLGDIIKSYQNHS